MPIFSSRFLLLPVLLLVAACASTSGNLKSVETPTLAAAQAETQGVITAGQEALAKGDVRGAYARFSKALAVDAENPQALLGLGEIYLRTGRSAEALDAFTKAARAPEHQANSLAGQGRALVALQRYDEAQAMLQTAVAGDASLWRAWTALGQVHDQRQEWTAAEAAYAQAMGLNGDSADIYNNAGVSLLMQQRYPEAQRTFLSALERDPGLTEAQGNLRLAYAWNGDYDKALANAAPTERAQILNNVGYIAMERGDHHQAEVLLAEAIRANPSYYKRAVDNLAELRRRTAQGTVADR